MMTFDRVFGGGCARKVSPLDLAANLRPVEDLLSRVPRGVVSNRVDLMDACELTLHESAKLFVTSSDLLYAVSSDLYTCGYVAAVHALSDIFAVLGTPAWATVTVGMPYQDVAKHGLASALEGVADALFADAVVFAGGHSVYSPDVFINVAVSGLCSEPTIRSEPVPGDFLVLTKPLGVGIALSALKLGLVQEEELQGVFSLLKESNGWIADVLRELRSVRADCIKGITDVSGFGFLHATAAVSGQAHLVVDASAVPRSQQSEDLALAGAISPLTDMNLLSSESFTRFEDLPERDVAFLKVLLNDPQTSGGLLAVLSPEGTSALIRATNQTRQPVVVGRYVPRSVDLRETPRVVVASASSFSAVGSD